MDTFAPNPNPTTHTGNDSAQVAAGLAAVLPDFKRAIHDLSGIGNVLANAANNQAKAAEELKQAADGFKKANEANKGQPGAPGSTTGRTGALAKVAEALGHHRSTQPVGQGFGNAVRGFRSANRTFASGGRRLRAAGRLLGRSRLAKAGTSRQLLGAWKGAKGAPGLGTALTGAGVRGGAAGLGAAGTALAAAGPFLAAGSAVVAFGAAVYGGAKAAESHSRELLRAADGLKQYNATIALAMAKLEMSDIKRAVASGHRTDTTTALLANQTSELSNQLQPIKDLLTNLSNIGQGLLDAGLANLLSKVSDDVKAANDIMKWVGKELGQKMGGNGGEGTGTAIEQLQAMDRENLRKMGLVVPEPIAHVAGPAAIDRAAAQGARHFGWEFTKAFRRAMGPWGKILH